MEPLWERLEDVYQGYDCVAALAGQSACDSEQVASVLRVMNEQLGRLVQEARGVGNTVNEVSTEKAN